VTKIFVEHEFVLKALNLPPQIFNVAEWSHPHPFIVLLSITVVFKKTLKSNNHPENCQFFAGSFRRPVGSLRIFQ
jgi:hypothetical protein